MSSGPLSAEADAYAWPSVKFDRCEANDPVLGETWSALTALFLCAAGAVPLFTSTYSDEEIDLVSALVVLNGIVSALSHSTLLRVFGVADALSLNICALVYVKAMAAAHNPMLFAQPIRRGLLNLGIAACILLTISWTPYSVPPGIVGLFDMPIAGLVPVMAVGARYMVALAYGRATWHLGRLKRVFLRGTIIFFLGFMGWMLEEVGGVLACPAPITLHSVWHVCSAHALMAWAAFLKYHRGLFFGFRPELKGWWWCPYTVWREPENADDNPIIRHTRSLSDRTNDDVARTQGRRNSYAMPKARLRPLAQEATTGSRRGNVRQLWRGASMHRMSTVWWSDVNRRMSRLSRLSKTSPSMPSPGAPQSCPGSPTECRDEQKGVKSKNGPMNGPRARWADECVV